MNDVNFARVIDAQFDACRETLKVKQTQYANGCDRLDGFKKAARVQGILPTEALAGMMAKHTTSIYEMIHEHNYDAELWSEKITDHINYLVFLMALVIEENSTKCKEEVPACSN